MRVLNLTDRIVEIGDIKRSVGPRATIEIDTFLGQSSTDLNNYVRNRVLAITQQTGNSTIYEQGLRDQAGVTVPVTTYTGTRIVTHSLGGGPLYTMFFKQDGAFWTEVSPGDSTVTVKHNAAWTSMTLTAATTLNLLIQVSKLG